MAAKIKGALPVHLSLMTSANYLTSFLKIEHAEIPLIILYKYLLSHEIP
jgi:hypothetical protein